MQALLANNIAFEMGSAALTKTGHPKRPLSWTQPEKR